MFSRKHRFAVLTVIGAVGSALPAYGYEYRQGDFSMQIDSTVSIGASWRASDRDYRQVGSSNALAASDNPNGLMHLHGSSAQDDSNLLWKKGSTFSEIAKITIDLEMNYKNYGAFIRGKAFYDHRIVNNDGITDRPAFYWQDDQGNKRYSAEESGHVVSISTFGDEVVCLPDHMSKDNNALVWEVDPTHLPAVGTKVVLRLTLEKKPKQEQAE